MLLIQRCTSRAYWRASLRVKSRLGTKDRCRHQSRPRPASRRDVGGWTGSRTWVDDGRMPAVRVKVITAVGVVGAQGEGRQHGSARIRWTAPLRGSVACDAGTGCHVGGPGRVRRQRRQARRGGAACSRIIDDASVSVAERVKAFKDRAAAPSTARITTARLPTTARPSSSARRMPPRLRTGARHTRARRTTPPPLQIAPRRSDRSGIWLGLQQPWRRGLRSA